MTNSFGLYRSRPSSYLRGNPDLGRASTSYVECKNGSLRQWCKRLTRLTIRADPSSTRFDFLRIESELAMTFIGVARSYSSPQNSAGALEKARKALEQIQRGLANPVGFDAEDIAFLERRCGEIVSALEDCIRRENSA